MWLLRLKLLHKGCLLSGKTSGLDMADAGYPLGHYRKGKEHYFMAMHVLSGNERDIKKYVSRIKKEKRIKLEIAGNMMFSLSHGKLDDFYLSVYEPQLIFPSPIVMKDGHEFWDVACWNRKPLLDIIKFAERNKHKFPIFEIIEFKKTKLEDVFIPQLLPKLSPMQKRVFLLACQHEYYSFPRKVHMDKLAKSVGITISTFQEHLRKAEEKIMHFLSKRIK